LLLPLHQARHHELEGAPIAVVQAAGNGADHTGTRLGEEYLGPLSGFCGFNDTHLSS
jgi:hypothetical protein